MLTNLNWLKTGEKFPPDCEMERITMYTQNRKLFEGKQAEVYENSLERIQRIIGNFQNIISYPVVLNYQRLMSVKVSDLLFGEPPTFKAENQDELDSIMLDSDLLSMSNMVAIDVSRYGDGLFYVRHNGTIPVVEIATPPVWYPIVSPNNVKINTAHVLAFVYDSTLSVQIHTKGQCEYRTYGYDSGTIGNLISTDVQPTGLDDFAVVQIPNTITSDRATGLDDYGDVDSIISELMVRIGQVSKILDKHASPSMQGPSSALERDPVSGEYRIKAGTYFTMDSKDDPNVAYITWDGQLESNFKHIEKLTNMLYTISEMGSAIFGDMSGGFGQVASGTALKRMMTSALAKVNRIRQKFDVGLKKAIILCGNMRGVDLEDLSITWQDGLPNDPKEEADIIKSRTKDAQTMSVKRALMQFDGLSDEQSDDEIQTINEEQVATNPATPFVLQGASKQGEELNGDTGYDTGGDTGDSQAV